MAKILKKLKGLAKAALKMYAKGVLMTGLPMVAFTIVAAATVGEAPTVLEVLKGLIYSVLFGLKYGLYASIGLMGWKIFH